MSVVPACKRSLLLKPGRGQSCEYELEASRRRIKSRGEDVFGINKYKDVCNLV